MRVPTQHQVNHPGGWCIVCGELEEYILASANGDTIEYEEFVLADPSIQEENE